MQQNKQTPVESNNEDIKPKETPQLEQIYDNFSVIQQHNAQVLQMFVDELILI